MGNSVSYLSEKRQFEAYYLEIREKEGRVLTDEQVRLLPEFFGPPHLVAEWELRKKSFSRFLEYIRSVSPRPQNGLDIGCGNGWFTYGYSKFFKQELIGLDVNEEELTQAARLFGREGLRFCYGDLFEDIFPDRYFDLITLNASIQYFPDLNALMDRLFGLLTKNGEIHILDSPFYEPADIEGAKERTLKYYSDQGVPQMANHYYHHSLKELRQFSPEIKYKPSRMKRFLRGKDSPFAWYLIRNK